MKIKTVPVLFAFVLCPFLSVSQEIKFSTILSYLKTNNEKFISDKLKEQKFIVSKERKSDVDFFDTRIDASRQLTTSILSFRSVSIMKIKGKLASLIYITLSKDDFSSKIIEIKSLGYKLTSDNGYSQWVYKKDHFVIAVEKKNITVKEKPFVRYEIGIASTL